MDDLLEWDLKLDERILTFNIPDEVLERAANAGQAVTWAYRNNGWQSFEWPQRVCGSMASINSRRGSRLFGVLTLSNVTSPNSPQPRALLPAPPDFSSSASNRPDRRGMAFQAASTQSPRNRGHKPA